MSQHVTSHIVDGSAARIIPPFENVEDYIHYHGVQHDEKSVTLYKVVHKKSDGTFMSDYNSGFIYRTGETATNDVDPNVEDDCGEGLHVSTLDFALNFGWDWKHLAIIECRVPKDKTVVPMFSTGKIRTSELTVVREVPLEECGIYGKILAKKRACNDK